MGRYAIFNGLVYGGGTNVIPNPEGTPTEELHSIQIGEDIYEIIGGSGASAIEKTQAEYDALTPAQKTNGAIYMVEGSEEVETAFDMTNIVKYIESSIDVTSSQDETTFTWDGGSLIGMTMYYVQKVDLTNAHTISYSLTTGTCYGGNPLRNFAVGVCETAPSAVTAHSSINYAVHNVYDDSDASSQFSNETLDVSGLTGEYYIVVTGFGWNATLSNIATIEAGEAVNKIYYMGIEYANTNGGSGGGSQELISYDTTITTTQYGWWTAEDKDGNVLDPDQYELIAVTPIVNNSSSWVGAWDGAFYVNSVDGTTYRYDVTFVNINDGGYIRTSKTWDVKVIYRDKNAVGGGGGSTVVPNPEEEPTDTLNTIEIDGVVYNIEGGSEGGQGLNPANYSTEEEVIGVWTNNLPVYKKTWTFTSAITVGGGSWADTSISVSDTQIHTIVNCEAVGPNGQAWTCISATTDEATQTYVRVLNTRDTDVNVKHLTLYYIKNGDSPIVPPGTDGIYNFYGMFVDANNEILPQTAISSTPYEYTATENCFVGYYLPYTWANDSTADIYVDNVRVIAQYGQGNTWGGSLVPLKKGQVIKFINGNYSSGGWFWVYGATYSINCPSGVGIETYSTTEEYKIGKWINGKTLYQKTLSTTLSGNQGSIDVSSLDIDDGWIVDGYYDIGVTKLGLNEYMSGSACTYTHMNDNLTPPYIDCKNTISADSTVYVTIKYTKNTEITAPAWTGIGTSLVDYSTSEKIVGTWIDGSPVYEKTIYAPTISGTGTTTIDSTLNLSNTNFILVESMFYTFNGYVEAVNMGFEVALMPYGVAVYVDSASSAYRSGITDMYITIRYTKTTT